MCGLGPTRCRNTASVVICTVFSNTITQGGLANKHALVGFSSLNVCIFHAPKYFQCNTIRETDQEGEKARRIALHSEPGPRDFPALAVAILVICMTINTYGLCNLFPYVGMMVKGLLGLETTNEAGMVPNAQPRCYTLYSAGGFRGGEDCTGRPLCLADNCQVSLSTMCWRHPTR